MRLTYPTCLILRVLVAIVCAWLVGSAAVVAAAEPRQAPNSAQDIERWVRELGSSNFVVRENAAQALLACGDPAAEALTKSARSTDREVRDRSLQILELVQARRRDATLKAFRAEGGGEDAPEKIPGWAEFSNRYGSDAVAREIYAEMLEAEWPMLAISYAGGDTVPAIRELVAERFFRLQRSDGTYQNYSRGTVLAFYLLAAQFPDEFGLHGELYGFARHPQMQRVLLAAPDPTKPERVLVRKLVGDWIVAASGNYLNETVSLQTTLYYRMHEEGSVIAERVLTNPNALPMSKNMAMQTIVLRNDVKQAHLIEPLLRDSTLLLGTAGRDGRERQLRDVALACLMKLNGHDLAKIGVKPGTNAAFSAFDYGTLGFTSEAEREQAFETYRKLQAEKQRATKKSEG